MKRLLLLAAMATPLMWYACTDSAADTETEDIVPKGMKALSLKTLGFPVKINIPDSAYYPTIDTLETPGGVQIRVGSHFDILVNTAGAEEMDLAKMKTVIEAGDELPKTFSVNDSTTLVWETKIGDMPMGSHFFKLVRTSTGVYYVRDNNNNPENQFKPEELTRMLEAAKSLRAIPAPKPES
jgi:hypothetical protein